MKHNLANLIYRKTLESQGCSVNLDGSEPQSGYMVGLKGYELKVNILDLQPEHIDHFIRKNCDQLFNRKYFIGTWIEGETAYIDISINLKNKLVALAYGLFNGQICIWDVVRKLEIYKLS